MSKKILVIEDDPDIIEICCDYLKAAGHAVVTAADGLTGLAAACREKPDLIVLDQDIMTCAADDIGKTKVLLTLVGGNVVYEATPEQVAVK